MQEKESEFVNIIKSLKELRRELIINKYNVIKRMKVVDENIKDMECLKQKVV